MSGLPAGPYYIYANIPTAGHKLVGATINSNETTLVALIEQQRAFTLTYTDESNGICMLTDTLLGGFLGVPKSITMNGTIARINENVQPHRWVLQKVIDGYTIRLEDTGKFWHVFGIEDPIRAASEGSERVQSWMFKPANSD
ncbi:hypothetical protein M405DRAFT_812084 [Rhizopogon salebrosus TDB-379]|nr:hypothetical protein M405DRAFT_812084 [Rhizopogon salebrosus TDB-379]